MKSTHTLGSLLDVNHTVSGRHSINPRRYTAALVLRN